MSSTIQPAQSKLVKGIGIAFAVIIGILIFTNPSEDNLARQAQYNHTIDMMGISFMKPINMNVNNFIVFSKGTVTVWHNPARKDGLDFSNMYSNAVYIGVLGNWFWINSDKDYIFL